jgi:hypothetical protein
MKIHLLFVAILSVVCVAGCCSATRISLCYDPDRIAREDDLQELRIVDVFDGGHPFVDEIVSCLKRDDFPRGSYTFCGILCHVVCETNGVPACVAEILQDGKTVYISVPFGSKPGMVYKKNGSYFVKDDLTPLAPPCYSIPELVEKVSCLVSDSFRDQERSGYNKVNLFPKQSD